MKKFLVIFLLDRLLKWYVLNLPLGGVFFSLGPLHFGHYLNPALFFFPAWNFLPWLALAALIALLISSFVMSHSPFRRAFLPIFLGGASNVFDRFAYGGVIDYVNILGLATINLADIMIATGILLIILKPYVKRS